MVIIIKNINNFSKNLKKYRLEKKYSQEKLAELCNLHRTYISLVELNKKNISLKNIYIIADALEIEVYKLFL